MDSGGKAEKSRGWILLADLGVVTTRFPEGDFFGRAGLAAFEGPAESLERRAGFLAGLSAGFVFPVGMPRTSVQIYQRSGPVGGPGNVEKENSDLASPLTELATRASKIGRGTRVASCHALIAT